MTFILARLYPTRVLFRENISHSGERRTAGFYPFSDDRASPHHDARFWSFPSKDEANQFRKTLNRQGPTNPIRGGLGPILVFDTRAIPLLKRNVPCPEHPSPDSKPLSGYLSSSQLQRAQPSSASNPSDSSSPPPSATKAPTAEELA